MTGTGRRSSKGGGKKSTTPTSTLKKSGNSSTLTTKTKGIVPQRRRAIAMSRQQPANPVEGDNAQPPPQPAVDPLARRDAHVQLQPYIAGPADADAGLVPGANPVLTSDESVAVLQAFLQRPDLPRSPKTKASLDHMRAVIAAHAANSLDETDLRNAMATMDLILVARQGIVPVGDALRAQRGPSLTEDSYKVVVDGQEIMSFNAAQIRQLQMACFGNAYEKDTRALGLVMAGFEFEGTMKELVNLVCAVHRCLADPGPARLVQGQTAVDGNPGVAEHVRQLLQEEVAERSELAKVFRDAALNVSVDGITAPQCRALHAWLRLHPNYLMNLKGLGVKGFVFGSKDIFDVGEYLGGKRAEVHMSAQPDKPADAFVRLVLHESGHAGFQRALIGETLTGKTGIDNARAFGALNKYVTYVQKRAVAAKAGLPEPPRTETEEKGERLWASLSANAQRYYQAWMTLKQNDGKFLIGEDQGRASNNNDMTEVNRQQYQADTFIEICAEGFSTFAMGDVDVFDAVIQSHEDVPDDVREAWSELHSVLREVGGPLLGLPPFV